MGKRGRKPVSELIIAAAGQIETTKRPPPPDELTDEQAVEWQSVINRMPADWFPRETWPLLVQYCRHIVTARRLQELIAGLEADPEFDFKAWAQATAMQRRESASLASLATKMRISQQTTYDKSRKKGGSTGVKPWDDA